MSEKKYEIGFVVFICFMCLVCSIVTMEEYPDLDILGLYIAIGAPFLFSLVGLGTGLFIVLRNRTSPFVSRHPWVLFPAIMFSFIMGAIFWIVSSMIILGAEDTYYWIWGLLNPYY